MSIPTDNHDCQNAVHEAFKRHCTEPDALSNALGQMIADFGQHAVVAALSDSMRIAYLRQRFNEPDPNRENA